MGEIHSRFLFLHLALGILFRLPPVDQSQLKEFAIVKVIPLQLDREIERDTQRRQTMRHLPGDPVQTPSPRVVETKPKVRFLEHLRR